jgi:RNA polymerase sigma factor (TIGR02999 family)
MLPSPPSKLGWAYFVKRNSSVLSAMQDLTTTIISVPSTTSSAANQFFNLLYQELRSMAHAQLNRSGNQHRLNTTTLVHESYLRFLSSGQLKPQDQQHFLAYASHVMRSVVVDHSRHRMAARRGAGQSPVTLDADAIDSLTATDEQVIKVHEALEELAALDARLAKIVEMRYFGGLKEAEIAAALGISLRTVQRDWEKARMLLSAEIRSG